MRRGAVVLLGWGALLGLATAVQTPYHPTTIEFTLLGAASAATLLAGLVIWRLDARSRREQAGDWRAVTEESFATLATVAGFALVLLGGGFGLWLTLIGAGVLALGLGGLLRERRGRMRATSTARARRATPSHAASASPPVRRREPHAHQTSHEARRR